MCLVGQIETEKDQKMLKTQSKIPEVDKKENLIIFKKKLEKIEKKD